MADEIMLSVPWDEAATAPELIIMGVSFSESPHHKLPVCKRPTFGHPKRHGPNVRCWAGCGLAASGRQIAHSGRGIVSLI
jgi:hypothetical protein